MGGKSGSSVKAPYEAPNTLSSAQDLRVVDAISEGVIAGFGNGDDAPLKSIFFNDTPVQNSDGSFNFSGVEAHFLRGTADQTYIPSFDVAERSVSVGAQVKQTTPITRTITDPEVSRLRVTLGVERNMQIHDNGDSKATETELRIELSGKNGVHSTQTVRFTEKSSSMYHQDVVFTDLPSAPFLLKVSRVSADSKTDKLSNNTYLISYVEQIDSKLNYPHTALCAIKINSEQFSNSVPTRNYLLRGKIIQVPSNYNPETRQYAAGLWDGSFKAAYSNNPVWVLYDLLTNSRYSSLASHLNLNDIDKWSLYNAAKYCDELVPDGLGGTEPRYTCNAYITDERQAGELLTDLASVFMGLPVWNGSQISVLLDQHRDSVAVYTNSNVVDGTFTYMSAAHKAIHTAITVQYIDKSDGYRKKTEFVADYAAIARYGYNPKSVTAFGCTSRGQAARFGEWLLQTELRQQNTVSFAIGRDGLKHLPYDVIQIADNFHAGTAISGRIVAISGSLITLDHDIELRGETVLLYLDGGVQKSVKIASRPKPNQIQLLNPVNLVIGDVWAISGSLKTVMYRAINIKENQNGTYTVTALLHDPKKYGIVDNSPHFDRAITTLHSAIPELHNATLSTKDGGVVLSWDNLTADGAVLNYDIKIFRNNILYRHIPDAQTAEIRLENLPNGNYKAEIRGRNARGVLSKPLIKAWQVNYEITGLRTMAKTLAIELTWTLPEILTTTAHTEIWYANTNNFQAAKKLVKLPAPQNSYTLTGVGVLDTFYFWARLVDENGNSGTFTEAVMGKSDPDPAPIVANIHGALTQSELHKDLIKQLADNDTAAETRAKIAASLDASNKVAAEARARIAADTDNANKLATETQARIAGDRAEAEARAAAITAETQTRTRELQAAANKQTADLKAESAKLAKQISDTANAVQANLTTKAAELTATATQLGTRITAAENVNAQQAQQLTTLTAAQDSTAAALQAEAKARADGDKAEAAKRDTLATKVAKNTSAIASETSTRNTAISAEAVKREALAARVATAEANITTERNARVATDNANTAEINAAKSRIGGLESGISQLQTTVSNNQQAAATQLNELKASFSKASGANLLPNAHFADWTGAMPQGWVVYNNGHATQPHTVSKVVDGLDKSTAIRIEWSGRNISTKGIYTTSARWEKGEYYVIAVAARLPEGQTDGGQIVLQNSNAPAWQNVEYLAQPTLNKTWQWTIVKMRKPVVDTGEFTNLYISVAGNFAGTAVELCLPYASKGEVWTGYKPSDNQTDVLAVKAELTSYKQAQATADAAQTAEINAAKSQIGSNKSAIDTLRSTKADSSQVVAMARTGLQSEWQSDVNAAKSQAATDAQTKADAAKAAAIADAATKDAVLKRQAADDATAKANAAKAEMAQANAATNAKITALEQTVSNQNSATASQINNLQASLNRKTDDLQLTTIDLTSLDENTWYPVTFQSISTVQPRTLRVQQDLIAGLHQPSWASHSSKSFSLMCEWTVNGSGWGAITIARTIQVFEFGHTRDGKSPILNIGQLSNSSTEYCCLRGGAKYNVFAPANVRVEHHVESFTKFNQTVRKMVYNADAAPQATLKQAMADINAERTARVEADNAQTTEINNAKSRLGTAESGLETLRQTVATNQSATTTQINSLNSKVGTAEANIRTAQTATTTLNGKVQALHTLKVETVAGGRKAVAGLALGADGATGDSQFIVQANKFAIHDGALRPVFVTVTQNGKTQTAISGDLIADGMILGKHLAASQTINAPSISGGTISGSLIRGARMEAVDLQATNIIGDVVAARTFVAENNRLICRIDASRKSARTLVVPQIWATAEDGQTVKLQIWLDGKMLSEKEFTSPSRQFSVRKNVQHRFHTPAVPFSARVEGTRMTGTIPATTLSGRTEGASVGGWVSGRVSNRVNGRVSGYVSGWVNGGNVSGNVSGNVGGDVGGDIGGHVSGQIPSATFSGQTQAATVFADIPSSEVRGTIPSEMVLLNFDVDINIPYTLPKSGGISLTRQIDGATHTLEIVSLVNNARHLSPLGDVSGAICFVI